MDPLQLGDIEVGEHAPAVGQRDAFVLQDLAIGEPELLRWDIALANRLDTAGDILLPFVVPDLIEPLAAGVLHVLPKARMIAKEIFGHIPDLAIRAIGEPDPQFRIHEQDAVPNRVQCHL